MGILALFTACSPLKTEMQDLAKDNGAETQIFAMDTVMKMTIYGENAEEILNEATQEVYRLEKEFSVNIEKSDVYQINKNAGKMPVAVSNETLHIIQKAQEVNKLTKGAFDITVAPIVKAWGFTTEKQRVPKADELSQLIPYVNSDWIDLNTEENSVLLEKSKMAIDLGGIAKGYSSDYLSQWLRKKQVTSAILSLGGNITAIGLNEGEKWKVAVQDPLNEDEFTGILAIEDESVITSGGYQRYFEQDGKRYHHIIDPKSGFPAESGLISVTIIAKDGTKADGLSTALFVMGLDKAVALWRNSDDFEVIFVTDDKKVLATEGIADSFEFVGAEQGYTYSTISR